MNMNRIRR